MSVKRKFLVTNIFLLIALFFYATYAFSYVATDFNWIPPFLTKDEKPTVHILFDSSGSMEFRAYGGKNVVYSNFNPSYQYYGYFNPKKYYRYTTSEPSAPYFIEATSGDLWNGNFLNWLTMHRDDIAKKVMIGGNYDKIRGLYSLTSVNSWSNYTWVLYDDRYKVTDLNGNLNYMTPLSAHDTNKRSSAYSYFYQQASSSTEPTILYVTRELSYNSYYHKNSYTLRLKAPQETGVLDKFASKARLSLFQYHPVSSGNNGANILSYVSETPAELEQLKTKLAAIDPNGGTPLAESLWTICGYIRQNGSPASNSGPRYREESYSPTLGNKGDPFYFSEYDKLVPCTQQTVIMITDGEASVDNEVTSPKIAPSPFRKSLGEDKLQDVAWWARTTDLRSDPELPATQRVNLFTIFASFGETTGAELLKRATQFGSFADKNKDGLYTVADLEEADFASPENFFQAASGEELEAAVTQALAIATAGVASGTSASLPPTSGEGEGAVYQAIFFQPAANAALGPAWGGQLHGLLVDSQGNMREDTTSNKKLDTDPDQVDYDKIIRFTKADATEYITRYEANGTAETKGLNINQIKLLWSSKDWLNDINDSMIQSNRDYGTTSSRYIFTFVDKNNNMVSDTGEDIPFTYTDTDCKDPNNFCSYLTLYENTSGAVAPPASLTDTQLKNLSERQINFIRGLDVGDATIGSVDDFTRSRAFGGKTWRLGDIIYSSPTVVGRPAENYHMIYKDKTYEGFVNKYKNRRQMVYVGANDGMLHAFNAGFYNSTQKTFLTSPNGEHDWPLGMEAWGYIPFNLLPHLKWLMHPEYGQNQHAAYMDLKPRVFDARVFFDDTTSQVSQDPNTYPNGWGTILVAGMRLGGAEIGVDITKDGTADRSMSSAYVIMDITDPEQPPKLLAEIALPGQGFTTCYPTVMPMTQRNTSSATENQWYLVFGSGPADSSGKASRTKFGLETSDQNGRLFVLDLKALVADKELLTVNGTGTLSASGDPYGLTEPNSFIFDPIAVDLDIGPFPSTKEFRTDLVYFGTTAGTLAAPAGKMYRFNTNNDSTTGWDSISTLIDTGKPITSAASVAKDDVGRIWVYFGAGRLFNLQDIPQPSKMSFYGIKEPIDSTSKKMTLTTVSTASLFNSSNVVANNSACGETTNINCIKYSQDGTEMTGAWPNGHWKNLLASIDSSSGWKIDFDADRERVLGQPAVLSGSVIFSSNTPTSDVCDAFDAISSLWAVHYKTGTAFYSPILGATGDILNTSIPLGRGLAFTPTLHVGEDGTTAFVQTSTGAILTIDVETPISVRSGPLFWRKVTD
ncbi:type IV pilus assembly protein PilY1 [Desulfomicrobium macestii]|uniref:Type IV pilus assembly protein PilY1 n=1 Tax=Desulfomicrobium macestii TaxID=90731 RepID=A0ABR9H1L8_9BACT|nr:PilC/PilY family type IV pilus protein [Desulfomicrobium macestii]MBE1424600.1 type IV pilus assembly protein PilY1 [Desulfomicrobium macestii]